MDAVFVSETLTDAPYVVQVPLLLVSGALKHPELHHFLPPTPQPLLQLRSLWPLVQRLGAPLFSLLICCMDMVPFVPCGPAAFTSGALYGSYVGFATAVVGQQAAAVSAFLVGRHVLARIGRHGQGGLKPPELSELKPHRGLACFKRVLGSLKAPIRLKRILDGLNRSTYRRQFITFLLLRQSPLVPFSICNYTVGALTRLPLLPFFLGTVIGCVPSNVLWVSMGAAARAGHNLSLGEGSNDYTPILSAIGLLATAVLLYGAVRMASAAEAGEDEALLHGGGRSVEESAELAGVEQVLPPLYGV